MSDPFRIQHQELDVKDVELSLRIRRSLAETIVIEIKDGAASVSLFHEVVKEVPFARKKKRK